jgi:hypothetical protein
MTQQEQQQHNAARRDNELSADGGVYQVPESVHAVTKETVDWFNERYVAAVDSSAGTVPLFNSARATCIRYLHSQFDDQSFLPAKSPKRIAGKTPGTYTTGPDFHKYGSVRQFAGFPDFTVFTTEQKQSPFCMRILLPEYSFAIEVRNPVPHTPGPGQHGNVVQMAFGFSIRD